MFKLNELTFDPMHFEYLMGTCTKVEHLYNEERKNHDYAVYCGCCGRIVVAVCQLIHNCFFFTMCYNNSWSGRNLAN